MHNQEIANMSAGTVALEQPIAIRKHMVLGILLLSIIASIFWFDSRYPALLKKLHAGPAVKVKGPLTFDNVLPENPQAPLARRVGTTFVNWLAANRVGMTFGFLFAAGVLSLLPSLRGAGSSNPYRNVFLGTLRGVPLGVCSNCVAPIGQGLYAAGSSQESALATMLTSPTLNVVVLALLFSLFPAQLALLKIGLTLALLFLVLPRLAASARRVPAIASAYSFSAEESWTAAAMFTASSYLKSLWYLLRTSLPLMLLAALLGALCIQLLPHNWVPTHVTFPGILLVSVIGTFLPVPMAFDVFASYIALRSGVPAPYVAAMLCTLGAYSVYSFLVTGRSMSWKAAASVYAAVCVTGIIAAMTTAAFLHI
jgi:uncharacterized membrane protein YraQ (UPF0718 family)